MTLFNGSPKKLTAASDVFARLKRAFTIAPSLKHPVPSKQFIVNISDLGVGAILSQCLREKPQISTHSKRIQRSLPPTERNNDVGDRELLGNSVVAHPVVARPVRMEILAQRICTAFHHFHRPQEPGISPNYQLNSCQAQWALFFARFQFTLHYWPGSKNTKSNAFSCRYPSGAV